MLTSRALRGAAAVVVATTFAIAGSVVGAPANLVTNGTFDTSATSWSGAEWNAADAGGSPSSGSARVVNGMAYQPYPISTYATQCIQGIVAGQQYRLSGSALVPDGQAQDPGAGLGADGYTGTGCNGGYTGTLSDATEGTGTWEALTAQGTFPAGTQSAMIMLQSGKRLSTNPSEATSVMFDNVTLAQAGAAGVAAVRRGPGQAVAASAAPGHLPFSLGRCGARCA